MNVLKSVIRIFERIEGSFAFIAVLLIIFTMCIVTADVIGRYIFNSPIKWSVELAENSIVWFTMLSAAWILRKERHVSVGVLTDRLNDRQRAFFKVIMSIIAAVSCAIIVVYGIKLVVGAYTAGDAQISILELPLWPLYSIIPLCNAMLVVRFIIRIVNSFNEWRTAKIVIEEKGIAGKEKEIVGI